MIIRRDVYLLLLGILIAFFVQVTYDFIHEIIVSPPNTQAVWEGAQVLIIILIASILFYVVSKARTYE